MKFAAGVLATVRAHAREAHPEECCGLLVGRESVERAVPSQNVSPEPGCGYHVDPLLYLACELQERRGGPRVLGFYHSHPHGDAQPSTRDEEESQRGYLYLIAASGEERLYRSGASGWRAQRLEEVLSPATECPTPEEVH